MTDVECKVVMHQESCSRTVRRRSAAVQSKTSGRQAQSELEATAREGGAFRGRRCPCVRLTMRSLRYTDKPSSSGKCHAIANTILSIPA